MQFKINVAFLIYFKMQFIPVIATLSFQQSSVSHDPSEIIIICFNFAQEIFINIIGNTLLKAFMYNVALTH